MLRLQGTDLTPPDWRLFFPQVVPGDSQRERDAVVSHHEQAHRHTGTQEPSLRGGVCTREWGHKTCTVCLSRVQDYKTNKHCNIGSGDTQTLPVEKGCNCS